MNRPRNTFTFVVFTISLILFGLFIPCFPLQKLLSDIRPLEPTLSTPLSSFENRKCPLQQYNICTRSFPWALYEQFVAVASNSVNFPSANSSGHWFNKAICCEAKEKGIRERFLNARPNERMLQVSGAGSRNGYILKRCHLRWWMLRVLCNDACRCDIVCKHCSAPEAF